ESITVDGPNSTTFADELDLVVRMPVRPRPRAGLAIEQEHRYAGVALNGSHKLMRTTHKRQILLAHVVHAYHPPAVFHENTTGRTLGEQMPGVLPIGVGRADQWRIVKGSGTEVAAFDKSADAIRGAVGQGLNGHRGLSPARGNETAAVA